jgi:hypothetical protein
MFYEHLYIVNKQEDFLIDEGMRVLENLTGIRAFRTTAKVLDIQGELDGEVDIFFNETKPIHFHIETKKAVRAHHLDRLIAQHQRHKPLIVMAEYILPKVKEQLRQQGIAYIETTGNIFIRLPEHFIMIEGKKRITPVKETNRAFTKTGLKVIFLFLQDSALVQQPYRSIAAVARVGLGNVNHIMNGLKALKLVVLKGDGKYFIADKKTLLEKWLEAYEQRLKPTLHLGTFRFIDREQFFHWRNIKLDPTKTLWGGEPAGDLLTNYLNPETLTLYTGESKAEIMRQFRLIPDPDGNVEVYKKFWSENVTLERPVVPTLLVYTDLINTGNQRCIDTAKKIYEQELESKFK